MEKNRHSLNHHSLQITGNSHEKTHIHEASLGFNKTARIVPPPLSVPTNLQKSVTIDEAEAGLKKLDYYEEISRKPIKILMTREISQYYGRETYLKTTIKEILIYILFVIVLSKLVLDMSSPYAYTFTKSMAEIFIKRELSSHRYLKYKDICTTDHIWLFFNKMMKDLAENFDFQTQQEKEDLSLSSLHENQLIGLPRIRIVRVRNDTCLVLGEFQNQKKCFTYFSKDKEDTKPFGRMIGTSWNYNSHEATGMRKVDGVISSYGGGGFYQDIPKSTNEFERILKQLKENKWIDRGTRAVFVDFTVYNANVNLFCVIRFLFEIPPTGGVIPTFFIHTLKLIEYGHKEILFLVCSSLFVVLFVFYTIEELYEMTYFKWEYIKSFWNFLDVSIVMMCYLIISTNLYQSVSFSKHLRDMKKTDQGFSNFEHMLFVQIICNMSTSLLIFFSWIKILKYIGINQSMYQLQATFQLACKDLLSYSVIFLAVFLTFAFLAHILYGNEHEFYYTFSESVWTLLRGSVGYFEYSVIEHIQPILGPFSFLITTYLFCYILVAMYIAILLTSYSEVRREIATSPSKMKIGDILQKWVLDILATFSHNLATRTREGINKRKIQHKFRDVQYLLLRCGFTELEINMFLAKYEISEDRLMTEEDLRNILSKFKSKGIPGMGIAREILRMSVAEKITAFEDAVSSAEKKAASILLVLDSIEFKMFGNVNK